MLFKRTSASSDRPIYCNKIFRQSNTDTIFDIFNYSIMFLVAIIFAYPLIFIISASLSSPDAVWGGKVWIFPVDTSIIGYIRIIQEKTIWIGYRNTLMYTFLGVIINLIMTVAGAYPLSRKDFLPRNYIMAFYTFTMYFSGGLIPTYLLVKNLHMVNTIWAMLIPSAVSVTNIIITRSYFQTNIPLELQESSSIDGCTNMQLLLRIVLPLSKPILAVMALFYGVGHWNAFFNALIYLSNSDLYPLQIFLRNILIVNQVSSDLTGTDISAVQERQRIAESMKYGIIIVSSLPVLVMYPFVQKFFVKGIMIGSLKG